MNIFNKAFCRIFQYCFRVAIPILPYYNPTILDNVEDISKVLDEKNITKVFLVTDKSIRKFGITKKLETHLADNGIAVTVFDDVVSNPTVDNVESARKLYLAKGCQALIGFGGGSAIDCAKAVGARIARPKKSLDKMAGILQVFRRIPLLFAIPTTAGTGTETTVATVITNSKTKHKYMISDFPLIPKYAVLDPEVTKTLPPSITASVGMDVLVHAVEAYIGNSTTKKTVHEALEAVYLVYNNLKKAYDDGNDTEARRNMLRASYLAGCAFTVSYVGYCHAVAHSLGGMYNIPHGLANAVLIPYVLEAYGSKIHFKLKQLGIAAGICNYRMSDEEAARVFIQSIKDMNKSMGIPTKIHGLNKADFKQLAQYASKEANPVYPVPVLMDESELEQFYHNVYIEDRVTVGNMTGISRPTPVRQEEKELVGV